jgi:hypothetical protein
MFYYTVIKGTYVLIWMEDAIMDKITYRKYKIKSKKRLILSLTITLMIISTIFLSYTYPAKAQTYPIVTKSVNEYANRGDTLWVMSGKHLPSHMDIRKYIDIVKEYNKFEQCDIQEGQMISFPIYE